MTTLPNAPRTGAQITAWIRAKIAEGYTFGERECLKQMHLAAGLPYGHDYTPNNGKIPLAIEAFDHSPTAVHETDPAKIPANVYVYFRSRKAGSAGHICWAPATGGHVLTTDKPKGGEFGDSTAQSIESSWGMDLVGYDRCLNGYRMSEEPPVKTKPPTKPTRPFSRGVNIDVAIKRLEAALAANLKAKPGTRAAKKVPNIRAALASLRKIQPS